MKGGVTCLGAMFCRQAKNIVADDAVIVQNHDYAAHTEAVDSESASYYYPKSVSGTGGSNLGRQNSSFSDSELVSGHASDPGIYRAKELESLCSSPILPHGAEPEEEYGKADTQFLKPVSPCAPSESDSVRNPDSLSAVSGHQVAPLSYESSFGGRGEGNKLSTGGKNASPRSEGAIERGTGNHAVFKLAAALSQKAAESHKRKPWWKEFLVSHRNAHLEGGNSDRVLSSLSEGNVNERMSPVNGYSSDMESKSGGRLSPSPLLEGAASDGEKERQSNSPRSTVRGEDPTRAYQLKGNDLQTSELLECEAKSGEVRAVSLFQGEFLTGDSRAFNSAGKEDGFTGKTGLSRVEEWVSSVHAMGPYLDQMQVEVVEERSESPTASAASFFGGPSGSDSEDRKQVASAAPARVDGPLDSDVEMAKMAAHSVNPLSTVAHFSGVGLKVIPSLGTFGSLKTLNLSANCFVRIIPGCLPKSLHSLDISRNSIVVIEGLRELTRLRVLNLSFNRISRIGNGLSSCTSLKEVYLAGNKISEVEGLHRLSKLVVLDLSLNKLTTTKSMGQIAANYKSLQSFNLLGNAVHSNLGDEQMRRFVTGICPQLVYLNKQALKSVGNREALGKELKGSSKSVAKPSKRGSGGHQLVSSTHRRTHSGGVVGNVKSKSSGGKGVVAPAVLSQGEGLYRKGHHQSRYTSSAKEPLPRGSVPLPVTANTNGTEQGAMVFEQSDIGGSCVLQSDGSLFCEDNHWAQTISQGIVQAH